MFNADRHFHAVEIAKLAGPNIHRADTQTNVLRFINPFEVDQSLQRAFESRRIVIADAFIRRKPVVHLPRSKKSGLAVHYRHECACLALPGGKRPAQSIRPPADMAGDLVPERAQMFQTVIGSIAGDECGVDCADRDPGAQSGKYSDDANAS